ncbi:MAG: hypothetical protein P4L53_00655 [Candidatus Obscuribacterales bacterium]|nr:hypothetical protein [Candidatus Obscuribacterales bacterium]
MVTMYTENGMVNEGNTCEIRRFDFTKTLMISLSAALLLSLVGAYNLNRDVKELTANTVPILQQEIAYQGPEIIREARINHSM